MKKTIIVLILSFILPITSFAVNYTSNDNNTGWWDEAGTWNGGAPANDDINLNTGILTIYGFVKWETQNSSDSTLTFGGGSGGTLVVEDTLVIYGNLHMGNQYDLTVNGILIVYGDVSSTNKITIASTGFLIIQGDMDFGGSQGDIETGDESNVYIGGGCDGSPDCDATSNDSTDLANEDVNVDDFYDDNDPACADLTPTLSSDDADNIICTGDQVIFTAGGGTNYEFKLNNASVQNGAGTTYTTTALNDGDAVKVIVTNGNGCVDSTAVITTTVNALPTATAVNGGPICTGSDVTLNETGGSATSWSWSSDGSATFDDNTLQSPTASGAVDGEIFTVLISDGSCTNSATTTVSVNALPTATAVNGGPICTGSDVTLNETGGSATSWSWSSDGSATFDDNTLQSPTASGAVDGEIFTVLISDGSCTNSATTTVSVNALPTATAVNGGPICTGSDVTLNETGGSATSWSWSSDGSATFDDNTLQSPTASGAVDGEIFTVLISDGSCTNSATTTVSVNALPTATAVNGGPICTGSDVTLNETGGSATSWSWSSDGSATFDDNTLQSPTASGAVDGEIFTVLISDGSCTNSATTTVSVNALPTATAVNGGPICTGSDVTLNETGGSATSWSWSSDGSATFDDNTLQSPTASGAVDGEIFTVLISDGSCTNSATTTVSVNALPTATAVNGGPICTGSDVTLNETGGSATSWSWSSDGSATFDDNTLQSPTASGAVDGEIFTVLISDGSCTNSATTTVSVNALPTATAVNGGPICTGSDVTLNETGGSATSWSWSSDGSATFDDNTLQSPTASGAVDGEIFTVLISDGSCTNSATTTVSVNALPTATAVNGGPICTGSDVTLNETGGSATSWSWSSDGSATFDDNTLQSPTASGAVDGEIFTVLISDGSCTNSATTTVSVNALPTATAVNGGPICTGSDVTLNETGGSATSWSWSSDGSATFDDNTLQSPTASGAVDGEIFTVLISDGSCTNSATTTVSVNALPTATAVNGGPICTGSDVTLNETGGSATSWSWSSDGSATFDDNTLQSPTASGAVDGEIFTVLISDGSCTNSATTTVSVNALPTATAVNGGPICTGSDVTLNETGGSATSWSWSSDGSATFDDNTLQSPTASGAVDGEIFTVLISDGSCTNSATTTVSVNALPTATAVNGGPICTGSDVTLNETGGSATSWSWSSDGSATFDDNTLQSPTASGAVDGEIFTVLISDGSCTNSATTTVSVNALPTATAVNGGPICTGSDVTLNETGGSATSWSWSSDGSATFDDNTLQSPTASGAVDGEIFTVLISDGSCTNSATTTVSVNALPTATAVNGGPICTGSDVTLNETGGSATSWSWSSDGSATFDDNTLQSPTASGAVDGEIFTVLISDGSCTNSATTTVSVNALPTATAVNGGPICTGSDVTLNETGGSATSWSWSSDGSATFDDNTLQSPTASGAVDGEIFTVLISDGSCTNSATTTVSVNALPTATAVNGGPICTGSDVTLNETGGSATSWSWSSDGSATFDDNTLQSPTASGAVDGEIFTVLISDGSCTNSATTTVSVNALPTATAVNGGPICTGSDVTLNETGGSATSWSWSSDGSATFDDNTLQSPTASGAVDGEIFTVLISDGSCTNSATTTVSVNALPTATAVNGGPICTGSDVTLNETGGSATSWSWSSDGSATFDDNTLQSPTASGAVDGEIFTVLISDGSCTNSATTTVSVNALPTATAVNGGPICTGSDVTLNETGGSATSWSWSSDGSATFDDNTLQSPTASGAVDGEIFTVLISDGSCTNSATTTVSVNALPTATAVNGGPICTGSDVTLNETGGSATSWSWSSDGSATFDDNTLQSPTASGAVDGEIFTVLISDGSCTNSATTTVSVNALPTATAVNGGPICTGSDVTLNETGGSATSWSWSSDGSATFDDNTLQSPTASGAVDGEIFTVLISDGSCTNSATTTVSVNALPTATAVNGGPICTGSDVTLNETGGSATSWSWSSDGSATFDDNTLQSPTASGAVDGEIFTVLISDGSCTNSATTTVSVNALPTATAVNGGPICTGSDVTLNETGGSATSWSWSSDGSATFDDNTLQSPTASGAVDGEIFTVLISDGSCTNSATTTVSVNALPTATAVNGGPICTGSDVTLNETGGSATSWSWSSDGSATFDDNTLQSPTASGAVDGEIFTVLISDGSCTNSATTTVSVNALPTATAVNGGPICTGSDVTLNETGGSATSWSWSSDGSATFDDNTLQSPTASGAVDGEIFTVLISDGSCTNSATTTVTVNIKPTITNPGDQISCGDYILPIISGSNLSGLEAYYTGPGGTGSTYDAGDVISSSVTTMYIYDLNGSCSDEITFDINIISNITIDNPGDKEACDSYTLPTITGTNLTGSEAYFTGSGGTGTQYDAGDAINATTTLYIYDINGSCSDEEVFDVVINKTPDIDDINNQTVCDLYTLPVITGLNLSGNEAYYTGPNGTGSQYIEGEEITSSMVLYLYDTNGSCSAQENFIITIISTPDVDDIEDQDVCESYTLPVITGENLTGNESYYSQSGGNGDVYSSGEVITTEATLYIYDENGTCSDEESFTINLRNAEVDLGEDIEICEGEEYTFTTDVLFNSYLWNDISSETEFTTGEAGFVWVEVTNDYQCTASDTVYLTVNSNPVVDLGSDTLLCGDESLEIDAGDFNLYEWSTGDFSSSIMVYAGEQEISVSVTDENGCTDSDTILILDCEESIFGEITNVFTPNNDGVHDTWIINGIELYPNAKIEVFDRSQRRVFYQSGNYSNSSAWDGTYNGKELPMDNYYYVIDLNGDGEKVLKGNLTIVK